jgi:HK97 family phage portal protein
MFDGKMVYQVNGKSGGAYSGLLPTALQYQSRQKWGQDKQSYAMAVATNAYVANAVNLITNDVTSIPYGVWDNTSDTEAVNHPFMLAMKENRKLRQQDLLQYVMRSRITFGEAYILPIKNNYGYHTGVQALNPLALEPFISNGKIHHFDYYGDRANASYYPNEIAFWRKENILDDLRGLSQLSSVMDDVNTYREIQRYTLDQFLRDLKLSGILTGRGDVPVTKTELDKALEQIKEDAKGRWVALNSALEFTTVQQEFDASATNVSEDLRKSIAVALGIPHSIAGSWDSATYQSAPEQRKFYLQSVVGRYCEELATFITDVVLPFYGFGNYEFYFDVDTAIAPLEDQQSKSTMLLAQYQAGVITLNQSRDLLGYEMLPGGDVLLVGGQPLPIAQLPTLQAPAPVAPATPVTPEAPATAALPAPALVVGKDAWVGLSLGNHPDLINLQRTLQTRMADQEVTWNKADEFHVTLLYSPAATDEAIATFKAALESVELPELALTVGSLAAFDNVGEYALHFRIKSNAALKELQEELYDLAIASGLQLSAYSEPSAYKPHVTMGYGKQKLRVIPFSSKYRVKPSELKFMADKTLIHSCPCGMAADAPSVVKAFEELAEHCKPFLHLLNADTEPSVNLLDVPYEPFNPLTELKAWLKKVENKGYKSATPFTAYQIPATIADSLRDVLLAANDDRDAIKTAFANTEAALAVKAIQATRLDFENALEDLLAEIMAGGITKSRARVAFMNLIDVHGNKAARDGFADGGVDAEPDADEQAEIDTLIREQRQYVNSLLSTLYSDEDSITAAMAEQKPSMWFNKSIYPIYTLALGLADRNGMYEWVYGPTEHCDDCQRLNGQRHRMKDWTRRRLIPKADTLECKGFNCKCNLVRSTGKAQGRF